MKDIYKSLLEVKLRLGFLLRQVQVWKYLQVFRKYHSIYQMPQTAAKDSRLNFCPWGK
jgi:hypothetical protein